MKLKFGMKYKYLRKIFFLRLQSATIFGPLKFKEKYS